MGQYNQNLRQRLFFYDDESKSSELTIGRKRREINEWYQTRAAKFKLGPIARTRANIAFVIGSMQLRIRLTAALKKGLDRGGA